MKQLPLDDRGRIASGIIVLALSALIALLLTLSQMGFFAGGDWLWPVLGLLFLLGLIPLCGLLARRRHHGVILLWCRRFSAAEEEVGRRNRWIWAVITEACRGLAVPVTLRDRSLAGSQTVGQALQTPLALVLLVLSIPLWLMLVLWALDRAGGGFVEWIVFGIALVLYFFLFRWIGQIVEFVTGTFATYEGDPASIRARLAKARSRRWNSRELDVIRCSDENWQDCVRAVLESSDLVLIDNVDESAHIQWEIERSQEIVGPDRVLMLLREGNAGPPAGHPIFLDFGAARTEIEELRSGWGDDDFGERVELGPVGLSYAALLRGHLESILQKAPLISPSRCEDHS